MNEDESVAVSVLLGMKESVVLSFIEKTQANTGKFHEHELLLGSASNANGTTNNSKHSNAKYSKDKRKRSDCISLNPQLGLSSKIMSNEKSFTKTKKPKLISPISVVDTKSLQPQPSNGKTNMASVSLVPLLSEGLESSNLPLMNVLSPKTTSLTFPLGVDPQTEAISHENTPVNVAEPAISHINASLFRQGIPEHQNSQLLTQDIVAALLTAEIQKMNLLVNAQQKELYSSNHVSNYIAAALSHQVPMLPGLVSSFSRSLPSPLLPTPFPPTSGEIWSPMSVSSPSWNDSTNAIATGHENDFHTNNMSGITNALLLNLLQQATATNSLV
jgi:hypothetical protein